MTTFSADITIDDVPAKPISANVSPVVLADGRLVVNSFTLDVSNCGIKPGTVVSIALKAR